MVIRHEDNRNKHTQKIKGENLQQKEKMDCTQTKHRPVVVIDNCLSLLFSF